MNVKLVLLPGMDGTGDLFADFVQALPNEFETEIVRYPTDFFLSYSELMPLVHSTTSPSEPFVLVAESFSTPLAIRYAATNPPKLKGVVLCAGFATSPVRGWRSSLCAQLSRILFNLPLPKSVVRFFLVGWDAQPSLVFAVLKSIASVRRNVLMARLHLVLHCDVQEELSKITVPILYVRAKQDRLVPAFCLDEIRHVNPRTTALEIPGPHLLIQREPLRTAEIVSMFARRIG